MNGSDRYKIAKSIRQILSAQFPKCFMPRGEAKLPLALGIERDIFQRLPDLDEYHVRVALKDYTSGLTYLRSMVINAARYDLDGNECGTVDQYAADGSAREVVRRLYPERLYNASSNLAAILTAFDGLGEMLPAAKLAVEALAVVLEDRPQGRAQ